MTGPQVPAAVRFRVLLVLREQQEPLALAGLPAPVVPQALAGPQAPVVPQALRDPQALRVHPERDDDWTAVFLIQSCRNSKTVIKNNRRERVGRALQSPEDPGCY